MKIKENIYLFFISFFISIIIWYGITLSNLSKEERWEKKVPIRIEIPNKLVLKNLSPKEIKIYGKGYKPKEEEIYAFILIEKTREGHYKVNISKEIIKAPSNCEIYKIEPQQVDIELENKVAKEVPFVLPTELLLKYKISIEPRYAKISGGESILKNIREFKVPAFQIPDKIPSNILLPISSPQKDIELISPSIVEIKIEGQKK